MRLSYLLCFAIFLTSCGSGGGGGSSVSSVPLLSEITPVEAQTHLATPSYTFHSTKAGSIIYGGNCASTTVTAIKGNNTITFSKLDVGTYSNCTIKVIDESGNSSADLEVTSFKVLYGIVNVGGFKVLNGTVDSKGGQAQSIIVSSDGKIILLGYFSFNLDDWITNKFQLLRFTINGSFDNTFGQNQDGIAFSDMLFDHDVDGKSVAVQSDNKILVAGSAGLLGSDGYGSDITLWRYNTNGILDDSFGSGGVVTTDLDFYDGGHYAGLKSVVVQSDGQILVAGTSMGATNRDFVLLRYNANGSLDTSFSNDGIVITDLGLNETGESIVVLFDGKILVSASTGSSQGSPDSKFVLLRYNANGSLDTSFSDDGIVTTDLAPSDFGNKVAVQSDDKILVAGSSSSATNSEFVLFRYNADGSLDSSFGIDGLATSDTGLSNAISSSVVVQADDKILLAGFDNGSGEVISQLLRYNSDGSLDASFGDDGIVITTMTQVVAAALQSDGKILMAGTNFNDGLDYIIFRYNADGTLDSTFY